MDLEYFAETMGVVNQDVNESYVQDQLIENEKKIDRPRQPDWFLKLGQLATEFYKNKHMHCYIAARRLRINSPKRAEPNSSTAGGKGT